MTQREDALKFEQGRNKALQEERLHIQKKTFTKWMNSFLQMVRMEVEDLSEDLADGRRLLKLLEIISGERLPRPNSGRMRFHNIENVNKSLSFLHSKVRLESIGAVDIVDGNPRLILGLIWTIILRFQIQEIEIDIDEENESSQKKSAKDALLLWCQRKTNGYHGVHIQNFSDSWRSGLGFNALIHAHRPDLFRWTEVPVTDHVETLNHAFEVAHKNLGIPKLLDAEDVDTHRPDEKSVMTYVAIYYHTFARMKNEQKSGRRTANIIGQLVDCDARKAEYSRLLTTLLEWIRMKISELKDRELPNSLDGIQRLLLAFKQYRTVEKPPKYKERSEIEALYCHINTMQKALVGEAWTPEGQLPQDLERAWQQLEQAQHAREIALRTELLRQQRLEQLNYKFNTKSVLRKGYLKEMIQVLSDPRYGSNLAQVDATVKKHEAISADILARTERFEDLSAMAAELVREKYHGAEAVEKTSTAVLERWRELLALLERHRKQLAELARLCALLREADAVQNELQLMRSQFQSEEVGRHLADVERLLQAHALQELQLGALVETIRRLVRQGNTAEGPQQPKKQLADQLTHLEDAYDSLVAAAKDRKARLEDARNLYQFLEDHDGEEAESFIDTDLTKTKKDQRCKICIKDSSTPRRPPSPDDGDLQEARVTLGVPEVEEFHSGVPERCEPPSGLRSLPNFERPIEMCSNMSLQDDEPGTPDVVSSSKQEKSLYQATVDPYSRQVALRHKASNTQRVRRKIAVAHDFFSSDDDDGGGDEQVSPKNGVDDDDKDRLSNSLSEYSDPIPEYLAAEEFAEERAWLKVPLADGSTSTCDLKVIEPYKRVLSHGGYTGEGCVILVVSACHLPPPSRPDYNHIMTNLFL